MADPTTHEISDLLKENRSFPPSDAFRAQANVRDAGIYERAERDPEGFWAEAARDMSGGACHCDLAFQGGEPIGIATWYWTYKSFRALKSLYVEDLYVRPAFRGQGLGRQFLVQLAQKARAAHGLMEWRVLDWNAPAIAFYQGLGARLAPEWRDCRLEGQALERLAS